MFIKQTHHPPLSWNLYFSLKVGFSGRASINLLPTTKNVFYVHYIFIKLTVYCLSRGFWDMTKISKRREQSDDYHRESCIFGGSVLDFLQVVSANLLGLSLVLADVT